jgi:hypothetical protein
VTQGGQGGIEAGMNERRPEVRQEGMMWVVWRRRRSLLLPMVAHRRQQRRHQGRVVRIRAVVVRMVVQEGGVQLAGHQRAARSVERLSAAAAGAEKAEGGGEGTAGSGGGERTHGTAGSEAEAGWRAVGTVGVAVGSHLLLLAPLGSAVLEPDLETERREVSGLGLVKIAGKVCVRLLKVFHDCLPVCFFPVVY